MRRLDDPLSPLIDQLHKDGRLRVWSLVITIFGDAIQPRGGRVSTARLQEILERMRIEPGALRTALSRLAKEGWVIREREGGAVFTASAVKASQSLSRRHGGFMRRCR